LAALKAGPKEEKSETGFSKPTMSNSTPVNTLTARVKATPVNPNAETVTTVVKRKIEDV
jgi:hypothetical protein